MSKDEYSSTSNDVHSSIEDITLQKGKNELFAWIYSYKYFILISREHLFNMKAYVIYFNHRQNGNKTEWRP